MKRTVFFASLFFVLTTVIFAQNTFLPRLAVVQFTVNTARQKAQEDAIAIRNLVQSNMVATGKYDVITRDEIDKLIQNQQIQISSISSSENVRKLQLLNINYIVTGTVDSMDNDYSVTISILDVSSGRFSHSTSQFMNNISTDIYNKTAILVRNFQRGLSSEGETVVQTGQGQRQATYKIGDIGPGGGLIFMAEGNNFMEVSRLLGESVWNGANKLAKDFRGGNFNDWRLPSESELDLIYNNLQKSGVTNLGTQVYWSSSQLDNYYPIYPYFKSGDSNYDRYHGDNRPRVFSVRAVRAFQGW
jgi:hypothetical protein